MVSELEQKQERMLALLDQYRLDALVLERVASFAWATCGASSYVNTASTNGVATLVITRDGRYLVTNNIEARRLAEEEQLAQQGWKFEVVPWYDSQDRVAVLTRGMAVGADGPRPGAVDLSVELARLRSNLTPQEGERFRTLGRLCAEAMGATMRSIQPGQTEREIAARLAFESEVRGVQAIGDLVATDERVFAFRHPLPTEKRLDHYAMVVLCGRKWGLVCSLTRLVHFGPLPDELRRKMLAVAEIDAALIRWTRPGLTVGDVFQRVTEAYARAGYPDEWRLHHQGGPAGYEPREFVAIPGLEERIAEGQFYAWNPSIAGAKSEDTFCVGAHENQIITRIPGWPMVSVAVGGVTIERPAVLETR